MWKCPSTTRGARSGVSRCCSEIPLPPRVGKAIKLGDTKASVGYPEPKTLGERLAQNLMMTELERAGLVERDEEALAAGGTKGTK